MRSMLDITTKLPNTGSNGRRKLSALRHIVIHHEAVVRTDDKTVDHLKADAKHHISKGWKRISYHYCISRSGEVYVLNPLEEIAYHAGNSAYNRNSFGIVLEGDMSKQRPTSKQVGSLWQLLDEFCTNRPDLPGVTRKTIKTHREVRLEPTTCPSEIIQSLVNAYRV